MSSTLLEVAQEAMGFPPDRGEHDIVVAEQKLVAKISTSIAVKAWLATQGLPANTLNKAKTSSLAKAYCISKYRTTWRNNANPTFAMLSGESDDGLGFGVTDAAPKAPPVPAAQPSTQMSEAWLRDLFTQINASVQKLVPTALSSNASQTAISEIVKTALITADLSPSAQAQVQDIARANAEIATKAWLEVNAKPREIVIKTNAAEGAKSQNIGLQHENFPKLLRAAQARNASGYRLNIWLTGPTGSGKTTAAENVARALEHTFTRYRKNADGSWDILNEDGSLADLNGLSHDSPFGADGSLDADYKVIGFKDANGHFHWTTFLRIYVFGGIYVADEIDNWQPSALLSLNSALANGWISTPLGMLKRHPDACIIACANTWGLGATNEYVGRSKLDAASLDRFHPKIDWPVDPKLERALAQTQSPEHGFAWHDLILQCRSRIKTQGLKIIISPRATFSGLALLAQGFTFAETFDMTIGAGLAPEQRSNLGLDRFLSETVRSAIGDL